MSMNLGFIQRAFRSANGSLTFTAAATTQTIQSVKSASHTIFLQKVIVYITTNAAQSLVFRDSAGTPVEKATVTSSPGDETRWEFDFGWRGAPLTEGKDLVAAFSAAGLAGHMEWYGYQRKTS